MQYKLNTKEAQAVSLASASGLGEACKTKGVYSGRCFHEEGGKLRWEQKFGNVVVTVGKDLILQTVLTGSSYSVNGPYIGLISSVDWTATSATDTMTSHAGWKEAGATNAPTFTSRIVPSFSTATSGAISTSTPVSFTMTGSGTLEGAFLVFGTGAVSTIDDTAGVLLSAGAFVDGPQPVSPGNVVQITYELSL